MLNKTKNVNRTIENITDFINEWFDSTGGSNAPAVIGISGGKDSTIAAALCVKALGKDRVIGVLMPNGEQKDIDDARRVCNFLNIRYTIVNIKKAYDSLLESITDDGQFDAYKPVVTQNIPPRLRMTTLYAVAASVGGRVCNTSNYSEAYVGYCTKWGDNVGDFAVLTPYTVTEVLEIGDALGLPYDLVHKAPADGLSGKTDEDNLGFTYAELDDFIRGDFVPSKKRIKMVNLHNNAAHKGVNIPNPQNWDGVIPKYIRIR